jgi:hypothetical protein
MYRTAIFIDTDVDFNMAFINFRQDFGATPETMVFMRFTQFLTDFKSYLFAEFPE